MHRHKRRPNSCLFPSLWIFIFQIHKTQFFCCTLFVSSFIFIIFFFIQLESLFSLHCNAYMLVLDFYYTTRCWKNYFFFRCIFHTNFYFWSFYHRLSLSECLHISVTFHVLIDIHMIWI